MTPDTRWSARVENGVQAQAAAAAALSSTACLIFEASST